ncbi:MAG: EAL domain-containing protein [Leptothrix sp. (in: b-proteobacteria)]
MSRYQAIVEAQNELISLARADWVLVYVNRTYAVHFGCTPQQMIGTNLFDYVAEADRPAVHAHLGRVMRTGAAAIDINRMSAANGATRWVSWSNGVLLDDDGVTPLLHSVGRDITDLVLAQQAQAELALQLAEQHERLRVTLHSIGDAVISTDCDSLVTYMNPVAERLTGWPLAEARGRSLEQVFRIVNEASRQPVNNPVQRCLAENRIIGLANHCVLISRDGSEYGIEDSAAPIRRADSQVIGVVLVFHDVTEQRQLVSEIRHRASHDALTGLVNRTEFEQRLLRALTNAHEHDSQHALLYIDLDQFKPVNDACGHAAGDRLLRQISAMLQQGVRSRDTLARLGGDEFGLILEHCSLEQAERIAHEVRERVEQYRYVHDGRQFRIGASIGLVAVTSSWHNTTALLQAADSACYAAKEAGRNRVHVWFDADQDATQLGHTNDTQWLPRLQRALDDNRFVLYGERIEPLGAAASGQLHCEVLLRLRDPQGALLLPEVFMAQAERLHMAARIDLWVVRQVLALLESAGAALQDLGVLSVNLSGASISDPACHAALGQLLAAQPAESPRICFEITESIAIGRLAETETFINAMQQHGVRFAIDGCGRGVSLLGTLKHLPLHFLKIDGEFVRDLVNDPVDQAMVRCIHEVAHALGWQTIAEFVDRAEVHEALRRIGIDHVQGFLLHQPVPLEAVLGLASGD